MKSNRETPTGWLMLSLIFFSHILIAKPFNSNTTIAISPFESAKQLISQPMKGFEFNKITINKNHWYLGSKIDKGFEFNIVKTTIEIEGGDGPLPLNRIN